MHIFSAFEPQVKKKQEKGGSTKSKQSKKNMKNVEISILFLMRTESEILCVCMNSKPSLVNHFARKKYILFQCAWYYFWVTSFAMFTLVNFNCKITHFLKFPINFIYSVWPIGSTTVPKKETFLSSHFKWQQMER